MNTHIYMGTNADINSFQANLLHFNKFYTTFVLHHKYSQVCGPNEATQSKAPIFCLCFGLNVSACCVGPWSAETHWRRTETNEQETAEKRGFGDRRKARRGLRVLLLSGAKSLNVHKTGLLWGDQNILRFLNDKANVSEKCWWLDANKCYVVPPVQPACKQIP